MNFLKSQSATHRVRIKLGAHCFQDHAFSQWPRCQAPGGAGQAADSNMTFSAHFVERRGLSGGYWECIAPGYGMRGDYGNGSIVVEGHHGVEIIEELQP